MYDFNNGKLDDENKMSGIEYAEKCKLCKFCVMAIFIEKESDKCRYCGKRQDEEEDCILDY